MTSVKNLMQNISFMIPQTNKRVIFGEDKFSSLLHSSAVGGKTGKTSVLTGFSKIVHGSGGVLYCYGGLTGLTPYGAALKYG